MSNQNKYKAITWGTFGFGVLTLLLGVAVFFPMFTQTEIIFYVLGWAALCSVGLFFGYKASRKPDVKAKIDADRKVFMDERYEKNPNALMFRGMYGVDASVPKYTPEEKEKDTDEIFEMTEK